MSAASIRPTLASGDLGHAEATAEAPCEVSVIVPVTDGDLDLRELYEAYSPALARSGRTYEFVVVASSESCQRLRALEPLIEEGGPLKAVEAVRTVNETGLLRRASVMARGDIIVTLPALRQVDPSALELLLAAIDRGADVAVARRWPRESPLLNRAQTWLLHRVLGSLGGGRFHDLGCGVRAMRRQVLQELPLYGELARFFPLLAYHHGFSVEEVNVQQHAADRRMRFHTPGVYLRRLLDVLGVLFVLRFTDRPLRFFGLIGTLLALVGSVIMTVLLIDRMHGVAVATRPLLLLGALLLALGLHALAFGLVGELIVHFNAGQQRLYRVKDIRQRGRA